MVNYPGVLCYATIHCLNSSDPLIISNIGQFISVDSRPVSCTRGALKQIIGLYKSYLGSGTLIESPDKPKDPILCMHITCPRASYDVNVEPAKDDVLFTNVDFVLEMFENFFKDTYGDIQTKLIKNTAPLASKTKARGFEVLLARKREPLASAPDQTSPCLDSASSDGAHINGRSQVTVLKQTSAAPEGYFNPNSGRTEFLSGIKAVNSRSNGPRTENQHLEVSTADVGIAEQRSPANKRQMRRPNAYMDVGDVLSSPISANRQTDRAQDWDGEEGLKYPSVSNPWTFAKINTPIRQHDTRQRVNHQLLTPGHQTGELDEVIGRQVHEVEKNMKIIGHGLPTPQRTQVCQRVSAMFQSSSPESYPFPSNASGRGPKNSILSTYPLAERTIGALDTWIQRPPDDGPTMSYSSGVDSFDQQDQEILLPYSRDFVSARTILMDTPRAAFPQVDENLSLRSSPPKRLAREPTIELNLPNNKLRGDWVGIVPRGERRRHFPSAGSDLDAASAAASVSAKNQDIDCTSQNSKISSNIPSVHPDLAKALDYEVRKQAAVKQWRATQSLRLLENELSQTPSSSLQSPHKNRYRRALATLRHPVDDTATIPAPALEYNDPRACLIRTQEQDKSGASPYGPRKRRKTSSLPLETVHEQSTARDLRLNIDTTDLNFYQSARGCASSIEPYDTYLTFGTISFGLSSPGLTINLVRAWEARVRELLKISYKTDEIINKVARIETRINLWPLMQTHLAAHA